MKYLKNALMHNFFVKMPLDLTTKDRSRKRPKGNFHVEDGLMFCLSCNFISHLWKSLVDKHLEAAVHKQKVKQNNGNKQKMLKMVSSVRSRHEYTGHQTSPCTSPCTVGRSLNAQSCVIITFLMFIRQKELL